MQRGQKSKHILRFHPLLLSGKVVNLGGKKPS
jgi:hypothetical protein